MRINGMFGALSMGYDIMHWYTKQVTDDTLKTSLLSTSGIVVGYFLGRYIGVPYVIGSVCYNSDIPRYSRCYPVDGQRDNGE